MTDYPEIPKVLSLEELKKHVRGEVDAFKNGHDTKRIDDLLTSSKFDPLAPRNKKRICLAIVKDGVSYRYGTLGNFSLVIGKAKSKKSSIVSVFNAAALKNDFIDNTIKGDFPPNKRRIIYFDTEQDNEDMGRQIDRAFNLAGGSIPEASKLIDIYNLSEHQPTDRIAMIGRYLEQHQDIGLMILDGVRDITYDINNSDQAMTAITTLIGWVRKYKIHMITVLHQNKGDDNARGHLGSECVNRAETVLAVKKDSRDKNVSFVEAIACRDIDFPDFYFTMDDNGLPHILYNYKPEEDAESKSRSNGPYDLGRDIHVRVLEKLYKYDAEFSYKDFCANVKLVLKGMGISIGDNASREFAIYYKNEGAVATRPGKVRNSVMYYLSGGMPPDTPF